MRDQSQGQLPVGIKFYSISPGFYSILVGIFLIFFHCLHGFGGDSSSISTLRDCALLPSLPSADSLRSPADKHGAGHRLDLLHEHHRSWPPRGHRHRPATAGPAPTCLHPVFLASFLCCFLLRVWRRRVSYVWAAGGAGDVHLGRLLPPPTGRKPERGHELRWGF